MKNISLQNITQAVLNHGDQGKTHPRLHEIYASLVRHLHAFVREVNLTEEELKRGCDFLTRVGRPHQEMTNGEVHMMTDLLGISELVELLHDVDRGAATEINLEGPVYVPDAPECKMGERIGVDGDGETLFMSGRMVDTAGRPIAKALVTSGKPIQKASTTCRILANRRVTCGGASRLELTGNTRLRRWSRSDTTCQPAGRAARCYGCLAGPRGDRPISILSSVRQVTSRSPLWYMSKGRRTLTQIQRFR